MIFVSREIARLFFAHSNEIHVTQAQERVSLCLFRFFAVNTLVHVNAGRSLGIDNHHKRIFVLQNKCDNNKFAIEIIIIITLEKGFGILI